MTEDKVSAMIGSVYFQKNRYGVFYLFQKKLRDKSNWFILTLPLLASQVLPPGLLCLVLLHNYEFFVQIVFFQKTVSILCYAALSAISASCAL